MVELVDRAVRIDFHTATKPETGTASDRLPSLFITDSPRTVTFFLDRLGFLP
jgi:hypothetical protein